MPQGTPFTSSHYGSVQGVRELLGSENAAKYWDLDSDGNVGTISIEQERALTTGDNGVNLPLAAAGVTVPILPSDPCYYVAQEAANRIAAVASYRFRGEPASGGGPARPYQFYLDEAKAMIDNLIAIKLYSKSTTGPTGPAADPITVYPSYPTNVTWGTPRWMWPWGW